MAVCHDHDDDSNNNVYTNCLQLSLSLTLMKMFNTTLKRKYYFAGKREKERKMNKAAIINGAPLVPFYWKSWATFNYPDGGRVMTRDVIIKDPLILTSFSCYVLSVFNRAIFQQTFSLRNQILPTIYCRMISNSIDFVKFRWKQTGSKTTFMQDPFRWNYGYLVLDSQKRFQSF